MDEMHLKEDIVYDKHTGMSSSMHDVVIYDIPVSRVALPYFVGLLVSVILQ